MIKALPDVDTIAEFEKAWETLNLTEVQKAEKLKLEAQKLEE